MKFIIILAVAYLLFRFYRLGRLAQVQQHKVKGSGQKNTPGEESEYIDYEEIK